MEGLGLVEVVPVGGSQLVRVQVLLRLPRGAIPALAVALIATGQ